MTDENDTRTPEERYEAGAERARAWYAASGLAGGDIPLTSKIGPLAVPNTKETK